MDLRKSRICSKLRRMSWSKSLLWGGLTAFVILAITIGILPKLFTSLSWIDLGVSEANEIGDTIGGIMGPSVGLLAALLTFFAFWAQFAANAEQRRQFIKTFKEQKRADRREQQRQSQEKQELTARYVKDQIERQNVLEAQQNQFEVTLKQQRKFNKLQDARARIKLFEGRFYTMLSIYRDNVNDMDLGGVRGRRVFLFMFDELRFIYWVVKDICDNKGKDSQSIGRISEKQIYQITYLTFFFGIGNRSTKKVVSLVGDKLGPIVDEIHKDFYDRNLIAKGGDAKAHPEPLPISVKTPKETIIWGNQYPIGVGHMRRLSHYIRHVFQIVKFVDQQNSDLLTLEDKYDYISNLRAQFSTNEQLLLYYNALSVLGEPWFTAGLEKGEGSYIEKYCLIKSIPLDSSNFYILPEECLPAFNKQNKPVFEWQEIKRRMEKLSD